MSIDSSREREREKLPKIDFEYFHFFKKSFEINLVKVKVLQVQFFCFQQW